MNRREFLASTGAAAAALGLGGITLGASQPRTAGMNIVFISVEDWTAEAVACYGNVLAGQAKIELKKFRAAFAIAAELGTDVVAALAGAVPDETVDANLKRFGRYFRPIARAAEKAGSRIINIQLEKTHCELEFTGHA